MSEPKILDFKWGGALVAVTAHSSGGAYHSSGEALLTTMIGLDGRITVGPTLLHDEPKDLIHLISEQDGAYDGQGIAAPRRKATLKFTVPAGKLEDIASGLGVTVTNRTIGGTTYKTVKGGKPVPTKVSILLAVTNVHNGDIKDFVYLPSAQSDTGLEVAFLHNQARAVDIIFNIHHSRQESFLLPNDSHAAYTYIENTTEAFTRVWVARKTHSNTAVYRHIQHDQHHENTVIISARDDGEIVVPGSAGASDLKYQRANDPDMTIARFDSAQVSGDRSAVFGIGATDKDDVYDDGLSEVHEKWVADTTWTMTAREFDYTIPMAVFCIDQHGTLLQPSSITINSGAVGVGTVVATFATATRGKMFIIKQGPTGEEIASPVPGTSWDIDVSGIGGGLSASDRPVIIQAWEYVGVTEYTLITPTSITWDGVDTYTISFGSSKTGSYILIY